MYRCLLQGALSWVTKRGCMSCLRWTRHSSGMHSAGAASTNKYMWLMAMLRSRPSPTNGNLGGIALHTNDVVLLCEAARYLVMWEVTLGKVTNSLVFHCCVGTMSSLWRPWALDSLKSRCDTPSAASCFVRRPALPSCTMFGKLIHWQQATTKRKKHNQSYNHGAWLM